MAVARSGSETIIRYSRGLIAVYYVLVFACSLMALLCLFGALGVAVEGGTWQSKLWSAVSWVFGALMLASLANQTYTLGRTYAQTFVAIGPDGVRLNLPKAIGAERHLKWEEIGEITFEKNMRRRVVNFVACKYRYTLTQNSCPSPETVAKMLAERKGIVLK